MTIPSVTFVPSLVKTLKSPGTVIKFPFTSFATVFFVWKSVNVATSTAFSTTVTSQVPCLLLPSIVFAVIVVVPAFLAVTTPLLSTVAISVLLLLHSNS